MNIPNAFKAFGAVAAVVWTLNVSANGFRLADQDAFATARGEAFAATADNASAIYYNPAGIAQLEGDNVRSGIYGIYLDPTFNPPVKAPNHGKTYQINKQYEAVPQFFYTHSSEGSPLSYGLGIYSPFGLSVSWPQDTGFRSVATKGSLVYIRVNPAMAIKLGENFSIGGGVTVNYVNMVLEQGLRGTVLPFRNFYRFEGDGWCVGYNLGALWKPDERVSIGASFRSSTTVGLDGKTEFEQQPFLFPIQNRMARSEFTFPLGMVVGLSYRPTPKWNLEFDADYTDWSTMGTAIIQMEKPPFPLRRRTPVSLEWEPSWMYEFGVTRYFGLWHVSGGYVFNENSVPNKFYTPLAADMDRHFFSVGTGVQGKSLSLDVAYQLGYGPAHTVTGSTPPSQPGLFAGQTANGTYKFTSQAVILTVGLHF